MRRFLGMIVMRRLVLWRVISECAVRTFGKELSRA